MTQSQIEKYKELAILSKEKNAPEGYVYVGPGISSAPVMGFGNKLVGFDKSGHAHRGCAGNDERWEYFCPVEIWEKTTGLTYADLQGKSAQKNMKTVEDVKNELAEAKELVGKRVTIGGKTKLEFGKTHLVEKVDFYLEDPKGLSSIEEAIENDGYCLALSGEGCDTAFGYHKLADEIQLNSKYTARITDEGVKVGCQTFEFKKVLELAEAVKKFQS